MGVSLWLEAHPYCVVDTESASSQFIHCAVVVQGYAYVEFMEGDAVDMC